MGPFTQAALKSAGLGLVAAGAPVAGLASGVLDGLTALEKGVVIIAFEAIMLVGTFTFQVMTIVRNSWVERTAARVDSSLSRLVARYTTYYKKQVIQSALYVDLKGMTTRGPHVLGLEDVYVELSIAPSTFKNLEHDPLGSVQKVADSEQKPLWFWLGGRAQSSKVLAVIGPPGSGKTTLLKHAALVFGHGGRHIRDRKVGKLLPVLIHLRDQQAAFVQKPAFGLAELIRQNITDDSRPVPSGWVERKLQKGQMIIMLDGLDELPDLPSRQHATEWLDRQIVVYGGCTFIVSSRPHGYKQNPLDGAMVLQVAGFSSTQRDRFIESWYRATAVREYGADNEPARRRAVTAAAELQRKVSEHSTLAKLAVNPLLLTMIAHVHNYRGALPGTRADLYKEVCEVFLGNRHQARGVAVGLDASRRQFVLQALAYELMSRRSRVVSLKDAVGVLSGRLATVAPETSVESFLKDVETSSGLLLERESGEYEFAHHSFCEYLAAAEVAASHKLAAEFCTNATDVWWRETVRLFVAQADATEVVRYLLQASRSLQPGEAAGLVALAAECMNEARSIDSDIRPLIAECLTPPLRTATPGAIIAAGRATVALRSNGFVALDNGAQCLRQPISKLEFFAYLLEASDEEKTFSAVLGEYDYLHEPALSLGREEAARFIEWFRSVSDSFWYYRLPKPEEVRKLGGVVPAGSMGNDLRAWTQGEDREAPLWLKVGANDELEALRNPLPWTYIGRDVYADDASAASSIRFHTGMQKIDKLLPRYYKQFFIDKLVYAHDHARPVAIDTLLERAWIEVVSVDPAAINEKLGVLVSNLIKFVVANVAWDLPKPVRWFAACVVALDRVALLERHPRRDQLQAVRILLLIMIAQMSHIASVLTGGAREGSQVAADLLREKCLTLYAELAVWGAHLDGSPAWGAILITREALGASGTRASEFGTAASTLDAASVDLQVGGWPEGRATIAGLEARLTDINPTRHDFLPRSWGSQ